MSSVVLPDDRRPPPVTAVTAGRWSFELRGDELADIRYDGAALLRGIRAVVRDHDWNTIPVRVMHRREEWTPSGLLSTLSLRFRGPSEQGPVDYHAELDVEVDEDGLSVGFAGVAASEFRRNRIGLVVLHPVSDAGRPVQHVAVDGSVRTSAWPSTISPHQPFTNVAGFRWERDGVQAELSFEGEVFESEDQRNWTDASFKTYGTPLALPFPVDVRPRDRVSQSVRLRARRSRGSPRQAAPRLDGTLVVLDDEVVAAVPALSVGASTGRQEVPTWARGLGVETVVLELAGDPVEWSTRLAEADHQAAELGAVLDVRLVTSRSEDVEHAVSLLDPTRVSRIGVFDPQFHVPTPALWTALEHAAETRPLRAALVAGTRAHFAELNRRIAGMPADAGGLTCSITPQMHATELPHLLDSLEGQRAVALDATRLAAGRPVWLGPVTLRQRFNAVATGEDLPPPQPDPLQRTGFTAAWTLGSIAALARPGVAGLCYFEVAGPGGLGDKDGPYPVGRLLASLVPLRGRPVLASRAPEGVAALAVRVDGRVRVFVGRLADSATRCHVRGPGGAAESMDVEPWGVGEVWTS
jgi:hypothetical protein